MKIEQSVLLMDQEFNSLTYQRRQNVQDKLIAMWELKEILKR